MSGGVRGRRRRLAVDDRQAQGQLGRAGELGDGPVAADQQRRRVAAADPAQQAGADVQVGQQRGDEPVVAELPDDGLVGAGRHLGQRAAPSGGCSGTRPCRRWSAGPRSGCGRGRRRATRAGGRRAWSSRSRRRRPRRRARGTRTAGRARSRTPAAAAAPRSSRPAATSSGCAGPARRCRCTRALAVTISPASEASARHRASVSSPVSAAVRPSTPSRSAPSASGTQTR